MRESNYSVKQLLISIGIIGSMVTSSLSADQYVTLINNASQAVFVGLTNAQHETIHPIIDNKTTDQQSGFQVQPGEHHLIIPGQERKIFAHAHLSDMSPIIISLDSNTTKITFSYGEGFSLIYSQE